MSFSNLSRVVEHDGFVDQNKCKQLRIRVGMRRFDELSVILCQNVDALLVIDSYWIFHFLLLIKFFFDYSEFSSSRFFFYMVVLSR